MNASETLFLYEDGDHSIIADIQGNIYGLGHTTDEAIDDAIDSGVYEEDLEGIAENDCPWTEEEDVL